MVRDGLDLVRVNQRLPAVNDLRLVWLSKIPEFQFSRGGHRLTTRETVTFEFPRIPHKV